MSGFACSFSFLINADQIKALIAADKPHITLPVHPAITPEQDTGILKILLLRYRLPRGLAEDFGNLLNHYPEGFLCIIHFLSTAAVDRWNPENLNKKQKWKASRFFHIFHKLTCSSPDQTHIRENVVLETSILQLKWQEYIIFFR